MFNGEESVRFESVEPVDNVFDRIEDELNSLGDARIGKRGDIDIEVRPSLRDTFTQTTIDGEVLERKGEYEVVLTYTCTLTVLSWVLAILFFPLGLLVILAPSQMKPRVGTACRRALRALKPADDRRGRDRDDD